MQEPLSDYLKNVKTAFEKEHAHVTEHSYRGFLQSYLQSVSGCLVTNEPKRQKCGAPDYIVERKGVTTGYIEAKDIGVDLDKTEKSEQLSRYLASLSNLILTDYLEFRLFRDGEKVASCRIANVQNGKIKADENAFPEFQKLLADFFSYRGITIKTADSLAKMMARKAELLQEITHNALLQAESESENQDEAESESGLLNQYKVFKEILIHDLTERQFADIYAQTITYGLFAARLNMNTDADAKNEATTNFTREQAAFLVPKTNPFLFKLFSYIAGPDIDDEIKWVVDELCDVFAAADLRALLKDFGTTAHDPFIHFYETFLAEYDPKLRKSRGVYYTPQPVVGFIVRSVDKILQNDFSLAAGLASDEKITVKIKGKYSSKPEKTEIHRVQILDPATGTGTFLYEVFNQIHKKQAGQEGLWQSYVEQNLLPRVHGFEILMAPYAMCHLKLGLFLKQTGYVSSNPKKPKRLSVFLTNSLEESDEEYGTLFAQWLSQEAQEANYIKKQMPVMVVLGNPPYSVSSSNKSKWILDLMEDYKKNLDEKNIQPLSDDYIKFIRFGQHFIDKKGEGILAYITNNSFVDGLIHRRMRQSLLETFDKIYILNLHGNSKKKETSPDGGKDENVFDIMQGVSIFIGVRNEERKIRNKERGGRKGSVFYADIFGKRSEKYDFLEKNDVQSVNWQKLSPAAPGFYFVPKDFSEAEEYEKGFKIDELMEVYTSGIKTSHDAELISRTPFKTKYNQKYAYRVFDTRYINYDLKKVVRPRYEIMKNFLLGENLGLLACKQAATEKFGYFITDKICDINFTGTAGQYGAGLVFPLYLYDDKTQNQKAGEFSFDDDELPSALTPNSSLLTPNLNMEIVSKIEKSTGLKFVAEENDGALRGVPAEGGVGATACAAGGRLSPSNHYSLTTDHYSLSPAPFALTPLSLLDYIYAWLHKKSYRERFKEFLKTDFPRIPFPRGKDDFVSMAQKGAELRALHLMRSSACEKLLTTFPAAGNNAVEKIEWQDETAETGKVKINASQFFGKVPRRAWEFFVGGYQPLQKYLKDRKGKVLSAAEIVHWQRIVAVLVETERIMREMEE